MGNSGISLNTNFQNILLPIFSLNGIAGHYESRPYHQGQYNDYLATATYFTIAVNVIGSLIFCWCLPRDKAQCKEWLARWRHTSVGVWNLVFGGGVLFFSLTVSILSALPATDCLQIAGGKGCGVPTRATTSREWQIVI